MHAFRAAVEARDLDAIADLLADDVRFTSPVAFTRYDGKPITAAILRGVLRVFEDFHYVREIVDAGGRDSALVFEATVDGKVVNGCDFIRTDGDGKIVDLMVMVRPLQGAHALSAAMGEQFGRIQAEAIAELEARQRIDESTPPRLT